MHIHDGFVCHQIGINLGEGTHNIKKIDIIVTIDIIGIIGFIESIGEDLG